MGPSASPGKTSSRPDWRYVLRIPHLPPPSQRRIAAEWRRGLERAYVFDRVDGVARDIITGKTAVLPAGQWSRGAGRDVPMADVDDAVNSGFFADYQQTIGPLTGPFSGVAHVNCPAADSASRTVMSLGSATKGWTFTACLKGGSGGFVAFSKRGVIGLSSAFSGVGEQVIGFTVMPDDNVFIYVEGVGEDMADTQAFKSQGDDLEIAATRLGTSGFMQGLVGVVYFWDDLALRPEQHLELAINPYAPIERRRRIVVKVGLVSVTKAVVVTAEHLQLALSSAVTPSEHLQLATLADLVPAEHLSLVTLAEVTPSEHLQLATLAEVPPSEHLQLAVLAEVSPAEHLSLATLLEIVPGEHRGSISKSVTAPAEHLSLVALTDVLPAEHLQLVLTAVTAPAENRGIGVTAPGAPAKFLQLRSRSHAVTTSRSSTAIL